MTDIELTPEQQARIDEAIRRASFLTTLDSRNQNLYDVLAVSLSEPHTIRVLDTGQTEWNAVGIAEMAIDWQGLEAEYYQVVPSGTYRNGDTYRTPPTEDNS